MRTLENLQKEESVNFGTDKLASEDHLLWAPTVITSAASGDVPVSAAAASSASSSGATAVPPPVPGKPGGALDMLQRKSLNSDGQPLQPAGKVK